MSDAPLGTLYPRSDKLLFRQIHPQKFRDGAPSKSNFLPEDQVNLSTRREEIGAKGAHEAQLKKGESVGTWAITSREAHEVAELSCYDDEGLDDPPLCEFHVSVRFPDGSTRGGRERIAKALHGKAKLRGDNGWIYKPKTGQGVITISVPRSP